jgi:predicted dehydrogenase
MADNFDCLAFYSLDELLNYSPDFDILVVCTPNGLHVENTIKALKKQKHVLCEKPLCFKPEEAILMKQIAIEANRKIWVVKQNRFNPPVIAVKKMLIEKQLGQIHSFQINCFWNRPESYYKDSWRGTQSLDGGVLYTQFSHFIDLLYWFLGDVKKIVAMKRNYQHPSTEIEDCGHIIFEMENKATGTMNYNINSYHKNMEGSFTIFGEKGTVKIGGEYLNLLSYHSSENQQALKIDTTNHPNEYESYQGSMNNHHLVYEQLFEGYATDNIDLAGVDDGMKTAEIISLIYSKAN